MLTPDDLIETGANMNQVSNRTIAENLEGDFRNKSYWLESLPGIEAAEPLRGKNRCDIAILGGGFTGLSTAYHLRKMLPGVEVRVMEANVSGYGSSGRNAGFSSNLFGMGKAVTAMRFGKAKAIAAHHYMNDAVDYVEDLIRENDIHCDFEKRGSMLIATSLTQVKKLEKEIELLDSWGLPGPETWSAEKLQNEFLTDFYRRGLYEKNTGLLNPARFTRGLFDLAKNAGAIIHELSPVHSVRKIQNGFQLQTAQGELHADRIVFATNAYSVLFPQLASRQTPIYQHIVLSEPLRKDQLEAIGWKSRIGLEDARGQIHYYRLTGDNRILMGGGNIQPVFGKNIHQDVNEKVFHHLKEHVMKIYPQLSDLKFSHQWGGPISITVDVSPVINYMGKDQRAIFSGGLLGHGVSMAPYNGLTIAEMLAGIKSKRTEAFFVDRKAIPWPPHLIRYPLLKGIQGLLKLEDRLKWD
jgi:glycine/D-amino acid oxidase-like deaminating enzyme